MRFALLVLMLPSIALADTASDDAARELTKAMKRHDAKAIAARLATPFEYHGAWFPDEECRKRFGAAGVLQTKERDAFARCFARLVPQLSTRVSPKRVGAVITIEPGVELEVTFNDEGHVRWLAPAGVGDEKGTPMLTAQVFEALRTSGTTLLDEKVRAELEPEPVKANPASAWIRTCLDATGAATRTIAWTSTTLTGEVFLRATSDWSFHPFTLRKTAMPACSISLLTYPASKAPSLEVLPDGISNQRIKTYDFTDDLDVQLLPPTPMIATIQPAELAALALAPLDPKPATPTQILHTAPDRLSSINVCINTKGTVKNVVTLGQFPGDRARAAKIWRWRFKPYGLNGTAQEACALLQFVVTP